MVKIYNNFSEEKLLLRPFSFYTKCFTAPDLFAGKMHALLFRKWKGRIKGRMKNVWGNPRRPTLFPIPRAVSQMSRGTSQAFIARRILRIPFD